MQRSASLLLHTLNELQVPRCSGCALNSFARGVVACVGSPPKGNCGKLGRWLDESLRWCNGILTLLSRPVSLRESLALKQGRAVGCRSNLSCSPWDVLCFSMIFLHQGRQVPFECLFLCLLVKRSRWCTALMPLERCGASHFGQINVMKIEMWTCYLNKCAELL